MSHTVHKGWKDVRLGDYVSIKHGFAFKGEYFTEEPNENVLLSPGNFNIGGGFKPDKFKYYKGEIPENYVLKTDDLIVTMTDLSKEGDTLGYPAKIPQSNKYKYLHNQRLGLIQFQSSEIDKNFLYYLMCTKTYQRSIVNSASGSTVRHTSPTKIASYEFSLPSLHEQRAISAVLSILDDKIGLLQNQNSVLESIAQKLFHEWFIEFNFPKESGKPYKKDGSLIKDSILGKLPENWTTEFLGDIVDVKGGSTPSTKNPEFWDGNLSWTSPKDLSDNKEIFLRRTGSKITEKGLTQISSGLLPLGTVLLSSRAPIGYVAISAIPVAINQGYIAVLPCEDYPNLFMFLWIKEHMNKIISAANGSTFLEISKSAFRRIEIVKPPVSVVASFMKIVKPIFQKIASNEVQLSTLKKLRDFTLPRLMLGSIRVKNI